MSLNSKKNDHLNFEYEMLVRKIIFYLTLVDQIEQTNTVKNSYQGICSNENNFLKHCFYQFFFVTKTFSNVYQCLKFLLIWNKTLLLLDVICRCNISWF